VQNLIVQKYGGQCMATPEKIRDVARSVLVRHQQGHPLIVVVSAMGTTTNDLVDLAYRISSTPNRRELDMLLSTGERVSMSLLSMALGDLGIPAISFTGSQAGILTDASHSSARIIDVRPVRIEEELKAGRVIVLAGFQGVNPVTKEITTLGRGGSDTTAVAIAARFSNAKCEIIKEVTGVCSADPRLVTHTQVYPEMSFAGLSEMCFWGAKILHYRSVELARSMRVPMTIRYNADRSYGTQIRDEVHMFENEKILAVNCHKDVRHVQISSASLADGYKKLSELLTSHQLSWPQILASAYDSGLSRVMLTSDPEHLLSLSRAWESSQEFMESRDPMASVTVTCHGSVGSDLAQRILVRLQEAGIQAEKVLLNPLSVTVIVAAEKCESAVGHLHKLVSQA